MELKDTVTLMESEDFKDRFRAEYYQVKIRLEKLNAMLEKYKAGTLPFKPECPYELLKAQVVSMEDYKFRLEKRAEIEGIEL